MTSKQGMKLRVGDTIEWLEDHCTGIVREATYAGVKIEWSDGKWCILTFQDKGTPWVNVTLVKHAAGHTAQGHIG